MADSDASELVAFCASIVSDGEVTEDEAYSLAEWLNEHPDVAETWPATELIQPLQSIWADGTASTRERHRLARILISIQREWPKRSRLQTAISSAKAFPEIAYRDVAEPRLPSLKFQTKIPSRTNAGVSYKVDLTGPSCTCPDWHGRRSRLPDGHLSRCCKHIFDAYAQLPETLTTADWLEAFLELAWPANPKTEWQLITINSHPVLYSSASDKGWANCFAKDGPSYDRYGYNVDERRWAYGAQPHSAWAISEAIVSLGNKPTSFAPSPRSSAPSPTTRGARNILRVMVGCLVLVGVIIVVDISNRLRNSRHEVPSQQPHAGPNAKSPQSDHAIITSAPASTRAPAQTPLGSDPPPRLGSQEQLARCTSKQERENRHSERSAAARNGALGF